jgi:diguanylate cyclase (GGDEF) domain
MPRFKAGGLFWRFFASLFLTDLLFFGVTFFVVLEGSTRAIIARQIVLSSAYRDEIGLRLTDWLSERSSDVEYLARSIDADSPRGISSDLALARTSLFASIEPEFSDILVISAEGMVIASSHGLPRAPMSVADRDYFKAASVGKRFISGLMAGKRGGSPLIVVSAPLRPGERAAAAPSSAVVAGLLSLESLSSIVATHGLGDLGRAFLLDSAGRVASSPDYVRRYRELGPAAAGEPIDSFASRQLAAGAKGAAHYENANGVQVIGAYARIEPIGLGLVVELSRDRALAPVSSFLASSFVLCAIMLAVMALLSAALSARLVAPIQALALGAQRIIEGAELQPISIHTGTEFDQLIELFNTMAPAIRDREAGLRDTASRDSLTGLYNHARIEEFLDLEIRRKRRAGERVSFVMLDIDHFKRVNDDYGHLVGDEVLRGIARILEESIRAGDIAGRYGGEEFSVIMDASEDEEVRLFCERIRKRVAESVFLAEGQPVSVTVSLGWTRMDVEGIGAYDIVRKADMALYYAKEAGRNKVEGRGADPEQPLLI